MSDLYDAAIIGAGPAGISAALTLAARGKRFLLFGTPRLSAKLRAAEEIRNYPGLAAISGEALADALAAQLQSEHIALTEKTVTGVYPGRSSFTVLCDTEEFEARTLIVTTGVSSLAPLPGESEFLGRGVSYCATCDGFLYRGKTLAVIAASADFEDEVRFLAGLAQKLYLLPRYPKPFIPENAELLTERPLGIAGTRRVEKLVLPSAELPVDGVFVLKDAIAPNLLVNGLAQEGGHVTVDRLMATNLPGCFAAGDVTGRPYQLAKAMGEGNVAAHSALAYLAAQNA